MGNRKWITLQVCNLVDILLLDIIEMRKLMILAFILIPLFTMAQTTSNDASMIGVLVLGTIAFLIMVIITRAIFMITTITRNLKLQTELLILIASKDADEATIAKIKNIYDTREKMYYNKDLMSRFK